MLRGAAKYLGKLQEGGTLNHVSQTVRTGLGVRWTPDLLDGDPEELAKEWERSLHGFAKRLEPAKRERFLAALDSAVYPMLGEAAVAADANGLHPKHALTRYHDFFCGHIGPGETVLDLGCGVGALARSIVDRRAARVTGMDFSTTNLAKAGAWCAACERPPVFLAGDITKDRAPGNFDCLVLSNVLEHIADRVGMLATWRQWYRASKLLVRVPSFERDWRVPWKQGLAVEWRLDLTHETEHTESQLCEEVTAAGWKTVEKFQRWGELFLVARG